MNYGISSEIMARTYENLNLKEKANITIKRLGLLDSPIPRERVSKILLSRLLFNN